MESQCRLFIGIYYLHVLMSQGTAASKIDLKRFLSTSLITLCTTHRGMTIWSLSAASLVMIRIKSPPYLTILSPAKGQMNSPQVVINRIDFIDYLQSTTTRLNYVNRTRNTELFWKFKVLPWPSWACIMCLSLPKEHHQLSLVNGFSRWNLAKKVWEDSNLILDKFYKSAFILLLLRILDERFGCELGSNQK